MREKIEEREWINWRIKNKLLEETNGRCAHCGISIEPHKNMTLEHIIPINKGGTNDEENLTVLCKDCNKLKSDMILPVRWYAHLPEVRIKALIKQMKDYLDNVDYLAEDCVMMMDTYRIIVNIPVTKKNRTVPVPASVNVIKMDKYEAFRWLMDYKGSLDKNDAEAVITHPSEWRAPCYIFRKGDTDLAMVCPYIIHEWNDEMDAYFNQIVFEWYFSPKLPDKEYIPGLLKDCITSMETIVVRYLDRTTDNATILLFTSRCFVSDRFCQPVFDRLQRNSIISDGEAENGIKVNTRETIMFFYIGNPISRNRLIKETHDEFKEFGPETIKTAMKYGGPFNKRFEKKGEEQTDDKTEDQV